ncbi:unnamed protein product [Lepeophtheirus salmonis]|uniref:(salmon louse) hypothetical protein n=1 Tax=Lepeophtheirus salmonis TaxID=72036 RepID=A0A7R8CUY6_LEPSM|nr:unnamed protein product [Lepeophtheirus salmonis]CAF2939033.1 unnamed protein product [Lepeophtheirus salmonis]
MPEWTYHELYRKLRRTLDPTLSSKKGLFLIFSALILMVYLGPSILSWLFDRRSSHPSAIFRNGDDYAELLDQFPLGSCLHEPLSVYMDDLLRGDAHIVRNTESHEYLPYVGNGYFGLSVEPESQFYVFGAKRTLNAPLHFKPLVNVELKVSHWRNEMEEAASIVHFSSGFVYQHRCPKDDENSGITISQTIFAHRKIPHILVQEIKLDNPSNKENTFNLRRSGIHKEWKTSEFATQAKIQDQEYFISTGSEPYPAPEESDNPSTVDLIRVVTIVYPKLEKTITVAPRSSETLIIYTALVYSDPIHPQEDIKKERTRTQSRATDVCCTINNYFNHNLNLLILFLGLLTKAVKESYYKFRQSHESIWRHNLWNTGFGISYSYADDAVNGHKINATVYYVLSQVPALIHSIYTPPESRNKLQSHLNFPEGCYGGQPSTLNAPNLWTSLATVSKVNYVVKLWKLSLEKHGCHAMLKAGADGVSQAMVLSFMGLNFRQHHLELNAHPKDLHRDFYIRRLRLGVSLEKQSQNYYYACDAGCLDPPVKLGTVPKDFPVKLTEPVTAILYITSDYSHILELKDTIHVREVADAPAHEHHVIALHKHVWQEYCSGNDKIRTRKYSDYEKW